MQAHFPDIFVPAEGHAGVGRWAGYRSAEAPLALSNQENYCMDCAGYLCIPGVLGAPQVAPWGPACIRGDTNQRERARHAVQLHMHEVLDRPGGPPSADPYI